MIVKWGTCRKVRNSVLRVRISGERRRENEILKRGQGKGIFTTSGIIEARGCNIYVPELCKSVWNDSPYKPFVMVENSPVWIGYHVAAILDLPLDKNGGVRVGGCGMDMGFYLVYEVSRKLFPDGFGELGKMPLGHEIRPATKEDAIKAIGKGATFWGRNGDTSGWDNDGGYAIKQRWL